ncbi:glycoside hydrolase family 2 protein [Novipirellula artificiosorum]|uniref:Beta-glucuronidase n=1 Tax=Novipirellula artificiosorum TaxID=2528016 RepID=A0A5C6E151_9BACT|nr:glycoside hydrolase family 2 TIM barrel-domain containing protein [Novipirellula artificiosorum]TWU42638.1 Beta-glucuronidase [Novipirellula artificiosorum]
MKFLNLFLIFCLLFVIFEPVSASLKPSGPRQNVSLDGEWEVAQGTMSDRPESFDHAVPVPGLVDMAKPAFDKVGIKSDLREAFWYRQSFTIKGDIPAVSILKLHKAKYGSKIWVNGEMIAEHPPSFTPGYFDVKSVLKGGGQENEIVIRVGADRESLPQDRPNGWDFEKYRYIPGIYDSVELILTGKPYVRNVQVVPDIDARQVTIVAEIEADDPDVDVSAEVTTASADEPVGTATASGLNDDGKVTMTIPIPNCHLWSPEDPFLYQVTIKTDGDAAKSRFGMRSFHFDPVTKRAMLNGKPYYMRGSNITLLRFFEDSARGDLPWREQWVRDLHRKCKTMHWNSLRYCIGFPPEFWYDIADEEGILIQDEFPIWTLNPGAKPPESPKTEHIVPQYVDWMRERWNHPCVVIWDAQNESETDQTGKALMQVRRLDLSNRPWDNGWGEAQSKSDCLESHPYLFSAVEWGNKPFKLSDLAKLDGTPKVYQNQNVNEHAIIINEYAWLWLTRDGNPTCLTQKVYKDLLGSNSTVAERREIYARYLAALTEFWRAKRKCAGVLHFTVLGYSRPGDIPRPEGGATSDHFLDVEALKMDPLFEQRVKDAFAPIGLMLDFWQSEMSAGGTKKFKLYVTNDLPSEFTNEIVVKLVRGNDVLTQQSFRPVVAAFGQQIQSLEMEFPSEQGEYELVAEYQDASGETVTSRRPFRIIKNDS